MTYGIVWLSVFLALSIAWSTGGAEAGGVCSSSSSSAGFIHSSRRRIPDNGSHECAAFCSIQPLPFRRMRNVAVKTSTKDVSEEDKDDNWEARSKATQKKFLQRAKRWVIVVDDEEAIRLAVGDYLYDVGYQVTACADAQAFMEVLSQAAAIAMDPSMEGDKEDRGRPPASFPDAIVCDIRMPGIDGLQLLSMIRADRRLSRVPVILLTAKAMTQDRKDGYLAGADAYLPKPFSPEELLSIVDNLIRRREEMAGARGKMVDLRNEMADLKQLLRQNSQRVVKSPVAAGGGGGVSLTPVEIEVLQLLAQGLSNGEIAEKRGVGIANVNRSIQGLYLKTHTDTRTQLVKWAIETGQVPLR